MPRSKSPKKSKSPKSPKSSGTKKKSKSPAKKLEFKYDEEYRRLDKKLIFSQHAAERMVERNISMRDVLRILKTIQPVKEQSMHPDHPEPVDVYTEIDPINKDDFIRIVTTSSSPTIIITVIRNDPLYNIGGSMKKTKTKTKKRKNRKRKTKKKKHKRK